MPAVGMGLWKVANPAVADLVAAGRRPSATGTSTAPAITETKPKSAPGCDKAIARGLCRRDELWITSKLWNTYHRPEHVRLAVERTLRDLRLDYLDLYLIHFPIALEYVPLDRRYPPGWFYDPTDAAPRMKFAAVPLAETWGAMEELVAAGLVKHIGVCNFNCCAAARSVELRPDSAGSLASRTASLSDAGEAAAFLPRSADCRDGFLAAGGIVVPRPEHGDRRRVGARARRR